MGVPRQPARWARRSRIEVVRTPQYPVGIRRFHSHRGWCRGEPVLSGHVVWAESRRTILRPDRRRQSTRRSPGAQLSSGSGGGIRTHDLWVMSPASCRCSTPRRASRVVDRRLNRARSGLASHAVARAVLSGAGVGHDPVRDGTGCCHTALGHAHTRREGKTVDGGSDR